MTAKDELRQALLNTCSISDEALTLLNGILDGSGGGGGGGSTSDKLIATCTVIKDDNGESYTLDKTWAELKAAWDAGIPCYVKAAWKENGEEYSYNVFSLVKQLYDEYNDYDDIHTYRIQFDWLERNIKTLTANSQTEPLSHEEIY